MDLVIVGVEASLWTAEQFAQDLKVSKADLAVACTAALLTALCSACLHASKCCWHVASVPGRGTGEELLCLLTSSTHFCTMPSSAYMFHPLTIPPNCPSSLQQLGIPSTGDHKSFFFVYSCCFSFHQPGYVDLMQAVLPALQITVISSNKLVAMLEHSASAVTSADLSSGR